MTVDDIEMTTMACPECGVIYAIPERWFESLGANKGRHYCPNGHMMSGTTDDQGEVAVDVDQLREENSDLRRQLARALHDAEQAEARLAHSSDAQTRKSRRGKTAPTTVPDQASG